MKTVKSLLLGSAAGVVALAGAQAADLPYAEPVEYVKVCSTYGEGFFYIPGTDTCLQISGKVRVETYVNFGNQDDDFSPVGTYEQDDFATRARGVIAADARTETEWGTLRSYVEFEGNSDTDMGAGSPFGDIEVVAAFVQFAGITAGRTKSFFDYKPSKSILDFVSAEDVWTLAYTASLGQGVSATIAVEDKSYRALLPGALVDIGDPEDPDDDILLATGDLDQTWPNIVANLRVSQSWGVAQLSAAVQDNEGDRGDYALPATVADDIGWAVQGVAKFNLPIAHKGSHLWVAAAYADGAISYAGAEERLGFGYSGGGGWTGRADQSYDSNGELANNTLLNVGAGFGIQASETVHLALGGTYIQFETAEGDELDLIQAEASIWWDPIDNLTFAAALQYGHAEGDTTIWRADDSDDIRLVGRIERNF